MKIRNASRKTNDPSVSTLQSQKQLCRVDKSLFPLLFPLWFHHSPQWLATGVKAGCGRKCSLQAGNVPQGHTEEDCPHAGFHAQMSFNYVGGNFTTGSSSKLRVHPKNAS